MLLQTKLHIPPLRPNYVPRAQLVERLNQGLAAGCRLTCVSAPAGFGKSTLLVEWLEQVGRPATWLALDEADSDPARFLAYLVAALNQVQSGLGAEALEMMRAGGHSAAERPLMAALTLLLNELDAVDLPFILILDDYHLLRSKQIQEAARFLLNNQPPQMHLVIATRADPPLPMARLRARAQLLELRAVDLAFTLEETAVFLNAVMDLALNADQVAALYANTEGWPAGLQMAALSLRGHNDIDGFVTAFTGSDRFILDYLSEEVLSRQPEAVQKFLIQTSILDRLCAPLCDAVTGRSDGQQTLEALEVANIFIVPLDNRRCWYRYHHLFADLMRQRLLRADGHLLARSHSRAGQWCAENDLIPEAISHYLAAAEYDAAANLIEKAAWDVITRGEMTTLLDWLDTLPDDVAASRPALNAFRAWSMAFAGQWARAEAFLDHSSLAPAAGHESAVRAYIAAMRGDIPQSLELTREALEELPQENLFLRSQLTLSLGTAYANRGDLDAAQRALSEAVAYSRAAERPYLTMLTLAMLGHIQELQGYLRRALQTHEAALLLLDEMDSRRVPSAGTAHSGIAEVLYEWNELERALSHALTGCELSQLGGSMNSKLGAYATLAQICLALGDWPRVRQIIREVRPLALAQGNTYARALLFEVQSRLLLAEGDLDAALALINETAPVDAVYLAYEAEQTAAARILLAREQAAEALALLDRLQVAVEGSHRLRHLIKIKILRALALQRLGESDQALAQLGQALALGEAEGFVRTFIDEGEDMVFLLRQALAREIRPGYAARLLAANGNEPRPSAPATQLLVEPLSERELQVLRLIVAGLSNREIAAELVVAVSTVKSHANHIYGKLGVKSRTQAIHRAQEEGLV